MAVEILELWKKSFNFFFFFLNGPALFAASLYHILFCKWSLRIVFSFYLIDSKFNKSGHKTKDFFGTELNPPFPTSPFYLSFLNLTDVNVYLHTRCPTKIISMSSGSINTPVFSIYGQRNMHCKKI